MSVYERSSYAPKSTVAKTVSTTSASLTKQRQITFATEWYWYPEGIKTVADRFSQFLSKNDLNAAHSWDEPFKRFRLRCRAEDLKLIAEAFRDVLATIIREELKKGYKEPWSSQDDELSKEHKEHYDKLLARLGSPEEDEHPDDEDEALELDVNESLGSKLIRRLKLHEDEVHVRAQINTMADLDSRRPVPKKEEYPASIQSFEFKVKWLGYFGSPLKLEKVFPDDTLAELKQLTCCEFSKCMQTGTLFIGCSVELGLQDAQRKLNKLKMISQLEGPYAGHILYCEGLATDRIRFALQLMIHIRKNYFGTTLLDNLNLAMNDSDNRQDGGLSPAWQQLCNAVTVRYALLDKTTGFHEAVKKVELLEIPTFKEASTFKDWDGFTYASRNESSYLRRYVDPTTGGLRPQPSNLPVPAGPTAASGVPKSASLNTIRQGQNGITTKPPVKHNAMPEMNRDVQKTMAIQQWQEKVSQEVSQEVEDIDHDEESKLPAFLRSPNYVEPSGNLAWDTYREIDIEQIRRNRMENSVQQSSIALKFGVAALKQPMAEEFAQAGKRKVPSQLTQSVSQPSLEQPSNSNQGLQKSTTQSTLTHQQPTQSVQSAPSAVTNSQSLNSLISTQDSESLINLESSELPPRIEPRAILDDDVSMVADHILLQPARPGDDEHIFAGAISLHLQPLQPMQPANTETSEDEDLICLTPPPELEVLVDLTTSPAASDLNTGLRHGNGLVEQLQVNNEADTRAFHVTMNQKAGKARQKFVKSASKSNGRLPVPSPPRARVQAHVKEEAEDPSPYLINDITESFTKLMDSIRFFRGPIVVQLEFGRIILTDCPQRMIWQKLADKTFDHDALRAKLNASRQHALFTKVLSLVPQEMEFLLRLKNREGKSLWQPSSVQPPKWTVTYEFHYRDLKALDSPFFLVTIDGETFKTQLVNQRELGETYVHGIARHWDYRIAATGYESFEAADSKAQGVHRAIEKSLHVPSQTETPRLLWEMENSLTERFQLVELLVKRVKKYAGLGSSGNSGAELNITEMQSLEVETQEVPERASCIFMAAPGPHDRPPSVKLAKWWEASITSVQLDKVVEENQKLLLGDEPAWAATSLDPNIATTLFLPACEMLKQMDGIGQHNKNGIVRQENQESLKIAKKPKIPEEVGFW